MSINGEPASIFLIVRACAVLSLVAFASFTASSQPKEEQFRIPAGGSQLTLFLRHLAPAAGGHAKEGRVVLILHGATLPSGASSAFKFDGHSWMDDLSEAGFDVWALDYLGYGGSDRYPEMSAPADANPPLGRANEGSNSIGNLLLHLEGSTRTWIMSVAGGSHIERDRQQEFDERERIPRAELIARLKRTLAEADEVLARLDSGALPERRQTPWEEVTVLWAVYHAVEHFAMHAGQIIMLAKMRSEENLKLSD